MVKSKNRTSDLNSRIFIDEDVYIIPNFSQNMTVNNLYICWLSYCDGRWIENIEYGQTFVDQTVLFQISFYFIIRCSINDGGYILIGF